MKYIKKKYLHKVAGVLFLTIFFVLLYKLLIPRISAFGCFDDCFNFMGGYFLLSGKHLFSQIFYNHAPLMAYISMAIQGATHPQNLFELILRHRQFVLLFGLLADILLFLRFGKRMLLFAILYELTKWYVFGDRFLAEGLIVYPLAYMVGIVLQKKTYACDVICAALTTWFVIFMREPYVLAALLLYSAILWKIKKFVWQSLILFVVLSLITVFAHNLNEFIYNVVILNLHSIAGENAQTHILGVDFYKIFFYPLLVLFQNPWSFFGVIEFFISFVFVILSGYFLWKKQFSKILFLWILLASTNFRYYPPGIPFYGAFHELPWYATMIAIIVFLLPQVWKSNKKFTAGLYVLLCGLIAFVLFSKGSYVHDKIDEHTEFITNYGNVLQVGNVVNALSQPTDTLFLDKPEDMIYFVANRYSQYQYAWYTSFMPEFPKYTTARLAMFHNNPPDFYYGSCLKEKDTHFLLPSFVKESYVRLYNLDQPSCLWVKKTKLHHITSSQWQKAGESLYFLQPQSR